MAAQISQNLTLWPSGLGSSLPVAFPAAAETSPTDHGLVIRDPLAGRAYALLGSGATPRGLAEVVTEQVLTPLTKNLPANDPRKVLPYVRELALALSGSNLSSSSVGGVVQSSQLWRVGALVALPIQKAATGWVVFHSAIVAEAALPLAFAGDPTIMPAVDLAGADASPATTPPVHPLTLHTALNNEVATLVASTTPANLGPLLAAALLENPYAACLRVVDSLRLMSATSARAMALALAAALTPAQLEIVAWTTGGAAALRRVWARLTPDDAAYAPVSAALGLQARPDKTASGKTQYYAADQRRPRLTPVEPPLLDEQRKVGGYDVVAMALGRRVTCGWSKKDGLGFSGPTTAGALDPVTFDALHHARIPTAGMPTAQFEARFRAAMAISPSEGKLDAGRVADNGLLSIGLQQWTFHGNDEGTVLLDHYRNRSPEHFDVFFGLYGLGTALCDANGAVDAAAALTPTGKGTVAGTAIQAANPHAFTAGVADPPDVRVPSYATLTSTQPDRNPVVLDAPAKSRDGVGDRYDVFGGITAGTAAKPRSAKSFTPDWAARTVVAGQCSLELMTSQLAIMTFRFTRVEQDIPRWAADWTVGLGSGKPLNYPTGDGVNPKNARTAVTPQGLRIGTLCPDDHTVTELFSSELAAASLLDFHINRPAFGRAAIMRAWQRTVDGTARAVREALARAGTPDPDENTVLVRVHAAAHVPGSEQLAPGFLARFCTNFLVERRWNETPSSTSSGGWSQLNPVMDHRTAFIVGVHDVTLLSEPGSFAGWS